MRLQERTASNAVPAEVLAAVAMFSIERCRPVRDIRQNGVNGRYFCVAAVRQSSGKGRGWPEFPVLDIIKAGIRGGGHDRFEPRQ